MKKVKKVWGYETWVINTDKYCGKILELKKDFRCSMHLHKKKDETFFILNGRILMELDGVKRIMNAGDVQRVKPGQKHRFSGIENSKIIEFSTHHEDSDSYRETKSEFKPVKIGDLK